MSVLIRLEGVCKRFAKSDTFAIRDIDTQIRAGEMSGLIGPDASGKTTLMRMMVGLLAPTSGSIEIDGVDISKHGVDTSSIIGYMPQKFGLYEDLTVMENMSLYANLRGLSSDRDERFERLLKFTDLKPFTKRLAGRLSGGMKQKLGLACALMGEPKILLLDEPSVGVDPVSRRELIGMVQELLKSGIAVVWSTSYLDEAEKCDKVLLLDKGKKIFDGVPHALIENVKGRTWHLQSTDAKQRRELLSAALSDASVLDGVIQGKYVRLVTRGDELPSFLRKDAASVAPRFEDAVIDALGGGPGGYSALAAQIDEKPHSQSVIIDAVGLTKQFGDFVAVSNNTFQIKRGEIFGLLGPNGAGKSTTFKMMCGLLQPTFGDAFISGFNLRTATSRARSKLGYMAQKFSLYSDLTTIQNLKFFSGLYGLYGKEQKTQIGLMTDIFDLHKYLNTKTKELPLGYKQRLALACAVMHRPDVLFLDEPTSGVDPITRREFWTHINGMAAKGVTIMVTTHFMDEAEYCDRVGLIYRGENIAAGTPDEIKNIAKTDEVQNPTLEEAFIELIKQKDGGLQ